MHEEKIIQEITEKVIRSLRPHFGLTCPVEGSMTIENGWVPLGVSARHLHVSQEHLDILYGPGHELTPYRPLYQEGEYAAEETVVLIGPRMRPLGPVRILGPVRKRTQIEVAYTDAIQLGVMPPVRPSGNLEGSEACIIAGPKGVVHLQDGLIRANRHVHLGTKDAEILGVKDNDLVKVRVCGDRPLIYYDVQLRVRDTFKAEAHLDTDDANAAGVTSGMKVQVIKD
jgi:putative phosphotransacetylase